LWRRWPGVELIRGPVSLVDVRVRIRVLGVLRTASEGVMDSLCFTGKPTVKDVILRLMEGRPALRSVLWDEAVGSPVPNALMLLDGVEVNNLEGLGTEVGDSSELVLLSVVHGG